MSEQHIAIEFGSKVSATYTFRDETGHLLDSSEDNGPMVYIHGGGNILGGIEQALAGRQVGEQVTLTLSPEQAYGPHRPELVFEAPQGNLPEGVNTQPGAEFYSGMGDRPAFSLRVLKKTENGVLLDGNHPLAGKTLHVELKVLTIQ